MVAADGVRPAARQAGKPGGSATRSKYESILRDMYKGPRRPSTAPANDRSLGSSGVLSRGCPSEKPGTICGSGPITLSTKNLRRPMCSYPHNAAGMTSEGKWHGRGTPTLGRGQPPPENNEQKPRMRALHPMNSHLLSTCQRDPIGVMGYCGLDGDGELKTQSRRKVSSAKAGASHLSALLGRKAMGLLVVDDSVSSGKKPKGSGRPPGATAISTKDRVMGTGTGLTEDDINPGLARSHRTAYGALRRHSPAAQPMSTVQDVFVSNQSPKAGSGLGHASTHPRPTASFSRRAWDDSHTRGAANKARATQGSFVFG